MSPSAAPVVSSEGPSTWHWSFDSPRLAERPPTKQHIAAL